MRCPRLGVNCNGGNLLLASAHDNVEWSRARKEYLGLTNGYIAEDSNSPKGTVDRILAGHHDDFKLSTFQPILRTLIGGDLGDHPCPYPPGSAPPDTLEGLRLELADKKAELAQLREETAEREKELRADKKSLRRWLVVVSVVAGISLAVLLALLIVDALNPELGYFWRTAMSAYNIK